MLPPREELTLFTVGHSNHSGERFLELLNLHGVEMIIDVRSAPYSRFSPHFNRSVIHSLLAEAGIKYAFAGEALGGRPKFDHCYKGGVVPSGPADYLDEVDYPAVMQQPWYQQGIRRLLELAAQSRAAVMCSEENPLECHRHHLIAQTLLGLDAKVLHIRRSGNVEQAKPLPPVVANLPLFAMPG